MQVIGFFVRLVQSGLQVRSWQRVGLLAGLVIALVAGATGIGTFVIARTGLEFSTPEALLLSAGVVTIAAVITVPIAVFALYILLMLNRTIDKVDASVRFDFLTGVFTRAAFLAILSEGARRGGYLLMLDADHFKSVNDRFGHHVGDEALKVVSAALRVSLRPDQAAGRLGGEEFAVFLPGASRNSALATAESIRATVQAMGGEIAGHAVNLTISIGLARQGRGECINAVMRKGDELLYEAKHQGRNRVVADEADAAPLPQQGASDVGIALPGFAPLPTTG